MNKSKEKKKNKSKEITECIIIFSLVFMFLGIKDFVVELASSSEYEIRCVQDEELGNGQEIYYLYEDGEEVEEVDPNKYNLLDENGNSDVKYCVIVDRVKQLISTILLGVMLIVASGIVGSLSMGTPFTIANVNRIKVISLLQLGFAVVPGMVGFVMTVIKFEHASGSFGIEWFYMFLVAFATSLIAHVFEYGVKLQDDVDSIV